MEYRRIASWCSREWPSIVIIAIGFLLQLFLVTRSFTFLLQNLMPEDAFMYFAVARNAVTGHGLTLDGIHITNGFHPLWMLIVALITKWSGAVTLGDTTAVRYALYLSVAMNAVSAFLVSRILSRFTRDAWVSAFGMIVWVLNPFFLYEGVNGLETSLTLMFFTMFALLALRIEEKRPVGGYLFVGFVGSLMVLARLDMAFYLLAFALWVLFRHGIESGWKNFIQVCVGALPFATWWIWNVLTFHILLTGASNAETFIEHHLIVQEHGPSMAQFLKAEVYMSQYILDHLMRLSGMLTVACGFIGAYVMLVAEGKVAIPRRLRDVRVMFALLCGFLGLFIADGMIRWAMRPWYFVSVELFVAIIVVSVADRLLVRVSYRRLVLIVLTCLVLFSFYVNWSKKLQPSKNDMLTQIQLVQSAQWMNANLPPETLVGTFSPGVQGFLSRAHIVELNGWVNNSAAVAFEKGQIWQYMKDEHVEYLWNYGPALLYRYKTLMGISDPFAHMTLVEDLNNDPQGLRLYKINY